ncbi:protein DEHYDRATION-INDUCED 19 homolog 4 [Sesamum indicum]|uniref:Protein DEHYDRATION-INDUCED 19 homolog 4 n=1 Tax=Sesamum indicum TaxID=4182 RepID=A0A6I9THK0_SESIN|nr:protein DEHYDRATION-INDUCED 19 homolog 4 [Sesamum indicum]
MGDRCYEDLEIALSSYSKRCVDDYDEEEEETEGEYEDEYVNDVENEPKSDELACPFCSEDFDVLGLCCHIDADHRMEVKPGICPVCATKVRINMASHVITQHENILRALCNKKHRSARSRSAIFLLRKDLQDKHLRCIKESPSAESSSNKAADSMLLSFVNNPSHAYRPQANESASFTEPSLSTEKSKDDSLERSQPTPPTDRNNEGARRREFLQGLVLSTIFDDL